MYHGEICKLPWITLLFMIGIYSYLRNKMGVKIWVVHENPAYFLRNIDYYGQKQKI